MESVRLGCEARMSSQQCMAQLLLLFHSFNVTFDYVILKLCIDELLLKHHSVLKI
jgi:hypothetical protein